MHTSVNYNNYMEKTDAIDRALTFIENTKKLGEQLKRASKQQQIYLSTLKSLYRKGQESSLQYKDLEHKSHDLQAMLDKWLPIYKERLQMIKKAEERSKRHL